MSLRAWPLLVVLLASGCFDPERQTPGPGGGSTGVETGDEPACTMGERHCACGLEDACDGGLVCIDDLCLEPDDASSGTGEGDGGVDACAECDPTPTPCHGAQACVDGSCERPTLPEGTPCVLDDACVLEAGCTATGQCVPVFSVVCDSPSDCQVGPGVCDAGDCVYEARISGTQCEDGDPCTMFDTCDGAGTCAPDAVCATDDPCAPGTCNEIELVCEFLIAAEGTSCGDRPTEICCAGGCTDTSSAPGMCPG